jgi:hypothetical protein
VRIAAACADGAGKQQRRKTSQHLRATTPAARGVDVKSRLILINAHTTISHTT